MEIVILTFIGKMVIWGLGIATAGMLLHYAVGQLLAEVTLAFRD